MAMNERKNGMHNSPKRTNKSSGHSSTKRDRDDVFDEEAW